ncbi:MAG: cupin domain-containing protein [Planctomycetota bacterium]
MQFVFSTKKLKRYRFPTHTNDLVMDRSQGTVSEVFLVILEPGEAPPIHVHDDTEQIYYVLEGRGTLTVGKRPKKFTIKPTDVVRVPPSTPHSIKAVGGPVTYLAVDCFVSKEGKLEPTWDAHVRVNCRKFGWKYADVVKKRR